MQGDTGGVGYRIVFGAPAQGSAVIAPGSLKKALYPALDLRYHKMISINQKALERGAKFVNEI